MKTIAINQDDSLLIERLFFQYNATKDIVAFLMTKEDLNVEALQSYMETAERRFIELEMEKRRVVRSVGGNPDANYMFNFADFTLTCEMI